LNSKSIPLANEEDHYDDEEEDSYFQRILEEVSRNRDKDKIISSQKKSENSLASKNTINQVEPITQPKQVNNDILGCKNSNLNHKISQSMQQILIKVCNINSLYE
jgi:hypothetical protein